MNDDTDETDGFDDADRRSWRELEQAIGPDPGLSPPPERVAALRAAAERRRALRAPTGDAPDVDDDVDDAADGVVRALPRRRLLLAGGIAAGVGGVGGLGGYLARGLVDDEPAPPEAAGPEVEPVDFRATAAASSATVTQAGLVNHTWGTELMVVVDGLEVGTVYDVEYRTRRGQRVAAGSLLAVDGPMTCRFNAAALRADLDRIVVRPRRGEPALEATLA